MTVWSRKPWLEFGVGCDVDRKHLCPWRQMHCGHFMRLENFKILYISYLQSVSRSLFLLSVSALFLPLLPPIWQKTHPATAEHLNCYIRVSLTAPSEGTGNVSANFWAEKKKKVKMRHKATSRPPVQQKSFDLNKENPLPQSLKNMAAILNLCQTLAKLATKWK